MEATQIPKSFWHALSFCMVTATLGILYIAQSSSSVSIEIANAKIELSSAISQVKDIKSELADENERLVEANKLMKEKIKLLEEKAIKSATGISLNDLKSQGISETENSGISKYLRDPKKSTWLKEMDTKIYAVEQVLKK